MTADTTWTDRSDASDTEFAEVLAKFDAAPAAEESLQFRVALAMATERELLDAEMDADGWDYYLDAYQQDEILRMASAAIAVMRGEQP